jgi:hypothetical protein
MHAVLRSSLDFDGGKESPKVIQRIKLGLKIRVECFPSDQCKSQTEDLRMQYQRNSLRKLTYA